MHSSMNSEEAKWYLSAFDATANQCNKDEFERFTTRLLRARYGSDFVNPRAQGRQGDGASDGYVRKESTVFQSYGPESINENNLKKKIARDTHRAKEEFPWMVKYRFFINKPEIPRKADQLAHELSVNLGIDVKVQGTDDLRLLIHEMTDACLRTFLEAYPGIGEMGNLTRSALDAIANSIPPATGDLHLPLPRPDKLKYNQVGGRWRLQLQMGMAASNIVKDYFAEDARDDIGERVISHLNHEYNKTKAMNPDADACLDGVHRTLAATGAPTTAILAFMAYAFELCKILEPPNNEVPP